MCWPLIAVPASTESLQPLPIVEQLFRKETLECVRHVITVVPRVPEDHKTSVNRVKPMDSTMTLPPPPARPVIPDAQLATEQDKRSV